MAQDKGAAEPDDGSGQRDELQAMPERPADQRDCLASGRQRSMIQS
jgi:hypothetical protein